jgi:sulfonate transport system permease protein
MTSKVFNATAVDLPPDVVAVPNAPGDVRAASVAALAAPVVVTAAVPAWASAAHRRRRHDRVYLVVSWLSPLLVLVVWQATVTFGHTSPQILPSPSSVWEAGRHLWSTGELPSAIAISLRRAAIGFVIGAVLGIAVGVIVGFFRLGAVVLDRPIQMLRAIPFFAITPLVIVWFGVGESGKIFLVALAVFFGMYINTTLGIRQVDPKLVEMGRAAGLSRLQVVGHIVLPGAVPSILTGVRISLTVAWLALVVGETLGASSGIGYLSINAREFLQTNIIVLVIVIYAVIGVVSDQIARLLERRLLSWHPNFAKGQR